MKKTEIRKAIELLTCAIHAVETGSLKNAPAGTAAKLFEARAALATTIHPQGAFNRNLLGSAASRRIRESLSTKPGI